MKLHWYASVPNIVRMGPYPSQVAAWAAIVSVHTGAPIEGGRVWCERAKKEEKR